ncbi:Zinc finger SWIM domain-containing protein 5 [Plecturocebus cupreus]
MIQTLQAVRDKPDRQGALRVCIILNPHCKLEEKSCWLQQLQKCSDLDVCLLEDGNYGHEQRNITSALPQSAIHTPACQWEHKRLLFNSQGQPLWLEHVPTACARVDALCSHGYTKEDIRLTVTIINTLRLRQPEIYKHQKKELLQRGTTTITNLEGWMGHVHPIGCLFLILTEACCLNDDSYLEMSDMNESRPLMYLWLQAPQTSSKSYCHWPRKLH